MIFGHINCPCPAASRICRPAFLPAGRCLSRHVFLFTRLRRFTAFAIASRPPARAHVPLFAAASPAASAAVCTAAQITAARFICNAHSGRPFKFIGIRYGVYAIMITESFFII